MLSRTKSTKTFSSWVHGPFFSEFLLPFPAGRKVCRRLYSSSSSSSSPLPPASELPPPRLDYRTISENVTSKSLNALNRKARIPNDTVASVARFYAESKRISTELNAKRNLRSQVGERIRRAGQEKGSDKDTTTKEREAAIAEASRLKAEVKDLESALDKVEAECLHLALSIPNDTHPSSPLGPEDAALTVSTHGPTPLPASPLRDHVSIAEHFSLLDLKSGATTTGTSWYFLRNEAALLELALVQYALSIAIQNGFTPVTTPDVVRSDIALRCGFSPRDEEGHHMYHLKSPHPSAPELVLAGTAEIPLGGMFANKVYSSLSLPLKVVGVGHAFRAEAGARSADTRGLYRVHQFTKVELFAVTEEGGSEAMMEEMLSIQKSILDGLELPYKVLDMPSEELGASAYRKYDIEAWMPGRGSWGEVSSLSNCTDYQSRRLHIRYRPQGSSPSQASFASSSTFSASPSSSPSTSASPSPPSASTSVLSTSTQPPSTAATTHAHLPLPFAHTLNGTAAAIPRLIVALLENGAVFDEESGALVGLKLPSALRPFWIGPKGRNVVRWDDEQ